MLDMICWSFSGSPEVITHNCDSTQLTITNSHLVRTISGSVNALVMVFDCSRERNREKERQSFRMMCSLLSPRKLLLSEAAAAPTEITSGHTEAQDRKKLEQMCVCVWTPASSHHPTISLHTATGGEQGLIVICSCCSSSLFYSTIVSKVN